MKTVAFLGSLLLASFALASPVAYSKIVAGRAVTVTAADLTNFEEYIQWASAAYCNVDVPAGTALSCAGGGCPELTAAGATVVKSLSGSTTGIAGFVGKDPTNKQIVVSFRGSSNFENWITNLLFGMVSCDLVSGCKVHDGFHNAWNEVSKDTLSAVASALAANPGYKLVVTGHSLGAAVATIAAAYLRDAGHACDLYTYGSPRVGNNDFANFVSSQAGSEYRVTHVDDPVPRLPPLLFGYRHTNVEFWLSTGDAETVDYTVSEIKVCTGIASTSCNAGTSGLDTDAHSYYFQRVGGCDAASRMVKDDLGQISEEDKARIIQWAEWDIAAVESGQLNE